MRRVFRRGEPVRKQQRRVAGLDYLEVEPDLAADDLPIVIGLHERGGSADELAGTVTLLGPEGFRYILPNGPIPMVNAPWQDGHAWYDLGRALDETIARSRQRVLELADELSLRHGTPIERMALLGFSEGAVMALDVGLRSERPFAGVAAMGGYLHSPETLGPFLRSGRDRRIFLLHGTYDDVMTVDGARLARDVLEAAGLEPEYRELSLGHRVSQDSMALIRAFLERVLPRSVEAVHE